MNTGKLLLFASYALSGGNLGSGESCLWGCVKPSKMALSSIRPGCGNGECV